MKNRAFAWIVRASLVSAAVILVSSYPRVAAPQTTPASPSGHWEGTIRTPGTELGILVDLQQDATGAWQGTIDIPMQGAKGLPLSPARIVADSVSFAISGVPGEPRFAGILKDGSIDGDFSQAGQTFPFHLGREKLAAPKRPQEPKPPFPYRSEEVTYHNGPITLAGTLTLPEGAGPFPAALLVTGSGAQNRDEEIFGHKPFLVLADHLTRAGIAVLRVDDRGVGGSSGKTSEATTEDFAGDALAGVAFLRTRSEIAPKAIGIIGHSEGGIIGPLAASRSKDVAFVIMMAGSGVPGEDVVLAQSQAISRAGGMPPAMVGFETALIRRGFELVRASSDSAAVAVGISEKAGELMEDVPDSLRPAYEALRDQTLAQVGAMTQPWFRYFLTYDPRPALRKVTVPILVMSGEKDLQVLPDQNLPEIEKALTESGNKDVTVLRLPGLNHLFQPAAEGIPMNYGAIETTIDPSALNAMSEWITKRFGGK